ncbi:MAG: FliH/SctL family protein [Bacteriovoracaceae bacterium]|nr:FliH/SctL family protein [Bacteriovoracaceae bacterium]
MTSSSYKSKAFKIDDRTISTLGEVREFTIPNLSEDRRDFKMLDFTPKADFSALRQEYQKSQDQHFKIDHIVSERRGHQQYEDNLIENSIHEKVEKKIKEIESQYKERGHNEGLELARQEIQLELSKSVKAKLDDIDEMVQEIMSLRKKIMEESFSDMLKTLQLISKWMVYKTMDQESILLLMKRAFHEIGTEQNILIKLDKENYLRKEDVLRSLIEEFGELKHIRFVCDEKQIRPGFQIELDNVLVDASFESQMQRIDLLFEKMREKGNEDLPE